VAAVAEVLEMLVRGSRFRWAEGTSTPGGESMKGDGPKPEISAVLIY